MPIRVNLLSEALAAEDLRRNDPVKRAIALGGLLVAFSLVWYSSVWMKSKSEEHELAVVQHQVETQTNDFALVQNNFKRIADIQSRLAALEHLNAARYLYGNLLNTLQETYVTNVQLTRILVNQSYAALPGTPAKTTPNGTTIPARPGTIVEHIVLDLEVKDSSPTPGDQVNPFKDAMEGQDYFKNIIDPTKGIWLANISPIQTASDGKPYVNFTLESRLVTKP